MKCDICGSEDRLYLAKIEGIEMNVCSACSGFGEVLRPLKEEKKEQKKEAKRIFKESKQKPESIEVLVPDFAKRIRQKREQLGLTHEDFAKKINEKKSVVHKMETGEFAPCIEAARRLEKILGLRLVEEYSDGNLNPLVSPSKSEELTIGDLIRIKKRK